MSRLIDADDLLQEFENENVAHNSDIWHITGIKAFIENQPIAFDTEKVVEQLEETRKTALNKVKMPIMIVCKHDLQEFADICFEESIDIVKKGGVE